MKVSERLQANIDLYQANGKIYRENVELFIKTSWLAVMHGQGLKPKGYHPLVDVLNEFEIQRRLDHIKSVIDKSVETMPRQNDYIN
jgi:tryptophan 7-halogenase